MNLCATEGCVTLMLVEMVCEALRTRRPSARLRTQYLLCSLCHASLFSLVVERSSVDLQWLLEMAQNDPAHYVRSAHSSSHSTHIMAPETTMQMF